MTDILNIGDLDGRLRFVRRARALARDFITALGGEPAPHELILIRSASELTAIAEQARAALFAGGAVKQNDVVRAENAMARAIRALNIPTSPAQTEDFGDMMQRLATPQQAAGAPGASDPAEIADDSCERTGGEMLPAEGAL